MIEPSQFPKYSEEFLRQKSEPVKDAVEAEHLNESLMNMFPKTGAFAVACPQIGILKQATLIQLPSTKEFLFVCNPEILEQEEEIVLNSEGCLSFPNDPKVTVRYNRVKVKYYDINFEERIAVFDGIEAIILQHERDHLNGILYKDRVRQPYRKTEPEIGRNSICPCGSGKKFKKCCGK
jgi:peptide deformylase